MGRAPTPPVHHRATGPGRSSQPDPDHHHDAREAVGPGEAPEVAHSAMVGTGFNVRQLRPPVAPPSG
ncbi:MAG TPA: hypothetical protein VGF31_11185, partial [Myxococcaceae bacterium]